MRWEGCVGGPQIKILDVRPKITVQYDLLPWHLGKLGEVAACVLWVKESILDLFTWVFSKFLVVPTRSGVMLYIFINYIFHFSHKKTSLTLDRNLSRGYKILTINFNENGFKNVHNPLDNIYNYQRQGKGSFQKN